MRYVVRLLVLALVALVFKFYHSWEKPATSGGGGGLSLPKIEEVTKSGRFSRVGKVSGEWDDLGNCRLIKGGNNDGDSFHIRHGGKETEFRLYFVDAPESAYRTYGGGENNGERLAEQGKYFGGLDRAETVEVGQAAKKFTLDLLGRQDFKIRTKWQNVYGPQRKYCFVIVKWEGREVYLHELLVANGLARIHTWGADLAQGRDWRSQKGYLKKWEAKVKKKGYGGWGEHYLN